MKDALATLVDRENLTPAVMEATVGKIMDGVCTPAQIGAFLAALRMKGETTDELVAAVRAMRARAVSVDVEGPLLDTCGTGGDGLGTFNVSTATAFVAAAAGVRVAKHGNRAASGKVGAADVLEALGARIELDAAEAARAVAEVGICFLFAPIFHPAVKHVGGPRRELGFRTLFNLTGPLCNPAGAERQLLGVYSGDCLEPVAHALQALGSERAMVVHGDDGSDEISPSGPTTVIELGAGGELVRYRLAPEQFGLERCSLSAIAGGDAAHAAGILRDVLGGKTGAYADTLALNAGAALYVGGHSATVAAGVEAARELIAGGAGLTKLDEFVAFTRRVAT